ncbi:MAG: hypothetical protein R3D80_21145 [Paracoccaceae bacterium]
MGEALGGVTVGTQDATPADAGATGPDAAAAQLAAAGAPDTTGGIDYAAWEDFASRVEGALESGKVSDSVLGDLRRDLVDARATFAAAKDENSVRIRPCGRSLRHSARRRRAAPRSWPGPRRSARRSKPSSTRCSRRSPGPRSPTRGRKH